MEKFIIILFTHNAAVRDCAALADPANGQVTVNPDTLEDSIATYSCNVGFDLNGDETRTCFNSGWGGEAPTCQGEEIDTWFVGLALIQSTVHLRYIILASPYNGV